MKKITVLIIVFSIIFPVLISAQASPCQDKEFLRLRDESINNMTEKEYQYFLMMSELCVLEINKSKSSNSIGSKRNILWILVGIQLVAFIYDDVLDLD
tara:strand:- start:521 stop:814 length:294 start_codon:yes stop_codon:yes gene_type:complete